MPNVWHTLVDYADNGDLAVDGIGRAHRWNGACWQTLDARRLVDLKCDPDQFDAIWRDVKRFELRINDRDYQAGDLLLLREFHRTTVAEYVPIARRYTGRTLLARVTYVLQNYAGLDDGYCVLSLDEPFGRTEP